MKYLFVHQNCPGQFLHIIRYLAKKQDSDIVFITESNKNEIPGIRRLFYQMPPEPEPNDTFPAVQEFERGLMRARAVARGGRVLKRLGFIPDIIVGHHGWGELLNIQDVFPDTPVLGYFEFFYHTDKYDVGFDPEFPPHHDMAARVRPKNAINLLALNGKGWGQTPTLFQKSTYPSWSYDKLTVLKEGVNTDICRPNPHISREPCTISGVTVQPDEKLVTYVARNLEPYRGFHSFMRALPKILDSRPDARILMVGGDGVSYGAKLQGQSWRDYMMNEVGSKLDMSRVHFLGQVRYAEFVKLLQRSDAHVYLTYPFVASWSLREAMAAGCAIVGSDTEPVQEFITHRKTGLLVPFFDIEKLSDTILELIENTALAAELRRNAYEEAQKNLRLEDYLQNYEKLINTLVERGIGA